MPADVACRDTGSARLQDNCQHDTISSHERLPAARQTAQIERSAGVIRPQVPGVLGLVLQPFVSQFEATASEHGEMIVAGEPELSDLHIDAGLTQFVNRYGSRLQGQAEQGLALILQGAELGACSLQCAGRDCNHATIAAEHERHIDACAAIEHRHNRGGSHHVYGLVVATLDGTGGIDNVRDQHCPVIGQRCEPEPVGHGVEVLRRTQIAIEFIGVGHLVFFLAELQVMARCQFALYTVQVTGLAE